LDNTLSDAAVANTLTSMRTTQTDENRKNNKIMNAHKMTADLLDSLRHSHTTMPTAAAALGGETRDAALAKDEDRPGA
jgi:hypothetical protein